MNEARFRSELLRRLDELGMTVAELSRRSGVNKDAIYKLKSREHASTSAENARAIAEVLGIEGDFGQPRTFDGIPTFVHEPLGLSDDLESDSYALIPVYDVQASAGPGLIAPDHEVVAYRLELPAAYLASLTDSDPRHLQVISVKGVSMLPTLKPGDLVMIDRAKTSLAFDGLFVIDVDGAILVKRIGRSSRRGFVNVISDNEDQPSFERATVDIVVLGKVICSLVKH